MEQQAHSTPPRFELRHRMALALEHGQVSKDAMADEIGCGVTTIRNYLRGRTVPSRAVLVAWALRCGVPFDWLAHGTEHPNDPNTQVSDDSSCNPPFADVRGISDHIRDRRARRRTIRKKAS
jgi:transcriptional regulator with XRE-family HTH domain